MGWDGIESLTGRRRHSHPEREVAGSYLKGTRKAQKKIHRLLKMRPGLEATNATLIIPTLPRYLLGDRRYGWDVLAELLH